MSKRFSAATLLMASLMVITCSKEAQASPRGKDPIDAKITFVELGSVNCIPCKKMQPVMASIEKKYGRQIKVVFHDVWKDDQKHFAMDYGIRLIPTQVFIDSGGKEIMRHEGFLPEVEIDRFLRKQGLTMEAEGGNG